MKITIESTNEITDIDGVAVRLWNGVTESGIKVKVFVHLLGVHEKEDQGEFLRQLAEATPPGSTRPVPLSAIL